MKTKPIEVEIVEEPEGRFIVRTYPNGIIERELIVRLPRKKRYPPRPYWEWKFGREDE
jgi:hypothetical protein